MCVPYSGACVLVCIHMYLVFTCVCLCVCVFVCVCVCVFVSLFVYACTHVCFVLLCVCVRGNACDSAPWSGVLSLADCHASLRCVGLLYRCGSCVGG